MRRMQSSTNNTNIVQTLAMSVASALNMKLAALFSSRASATALEQASMTSLDSLGRTFSRLNRNFQQKTRTRHGFQTIIPAFDGTQAIQVCLHKRDGVGNLQVCWCEPAMSAPKSSEGSKRVHRWGDCVGRGSSSPCPPCCGLRLHWLEHPPLVKCGRRRRARWWGGKAAIAAKAKGRVA
jgi:hypothetical protein